MGGMCQKCTYRIQWASVGLFNQNRFTYGTMLQFFRELRSGVAFLNGFSSLQMTYCDLSVPLRTRIPKWLLIAGSRWNIARAMLLYELAIWTLKDRTSSRVRLFVALHRLLRGPRTKRNALLYLSRLDLLRRDIRDLHK